MMKNPEYALFLRIEGRPCVVVGGGRIAARKVSKLLLSGASVTVVSPILCTELDEHASIGLVQHVPRAYRPGDTNGAFLTFAATDDRLVNEAVAHEVLSRGGLVNVADHPELCSFLVPATWSDESLQIAISTGGKSPRVAKELRVALDEDLTRDDNGGREESRFLSAVHRFRSSTPSRNSG